MQTAQQKMNVAMEIGPKKTGLTINACFPDATFLLFKNAASSNKHRNLSVHVGSQRINRTSDFLSSPAKLKIAKGAWPRWSRGNRKGDTPQSSFQARGDHQNSYEKATQQCSKAIPLTSMPRMTPKGRYLVTLPTLIVEVSITSTTQSCSKVLKSCNCSCDPQKFRICDPHLRNTLSHFWNDFLNQKFSSRVHRCVHLDHLQTMLTFLTTPWAANWRVIRVSRRCDLTSPRKLPVNGWRCLHPV